MKQTMQKKKEQIELIEKDILKTVLLKCNYQWDKRLNKLVKEGISNYENHSIKDTANQTFSSKFSESKLDTSYLIRTSLAHKLKSISPEKIRNS